MKYSQSLLVWIPVWSIWALISAVFEPGCTAFLSTCQLVFPDHSVCCFPSSWRALLACEVLLRKFLYSLLPHKLNLSSPKENKDLSHWTTGLFEEVTLQRGRCKAITFFFHPHLCEMKYIPSARGIGGWRRLSLHCCPSMFEQESIVDIGIETSQGFLCLFVEVEEGRRESAKQKCILVCCFHVGRETYTLCLTFSTASTVLMPVAWMEHGLPWPCHQLPEVPSEIYCLG